MGAVGCPKKGAGGDGLSTHPPWVVLLPWPHPAPPHPSPLLFPKETHANPHATHHQTPRKNFRAQKGECCPACPLPTARSLDHRALEVPAAPPLADAAQAISVAAVGQDPEEPLLGQRLLVHPVHADATHHGLALRSQRERAGAGQGCRSTRLCRDLQAEQHGMETPWLCHQPGLEGHRRVVTRSARPREIPNPPLQGQSVSLPPKLPFWD